MESVEAAAALLIPDIEGLDIYSFPFTSNLSESDSLDEEEDRDSEESTSIPDDVDVASVTGIPEGKHVKLILMANSYNSNRKWGARLMQHYRHAVFAGAYVDGCFVQDESSDE